MRVLNLGINVIVTHDMISYYMSIWDMNNIMECGTKVNEFVVFVAKEINLILIIPSSEAQKLSCNFFFYRK